MRLTTLAIALGIGVVPAMAAGWNPKLAAAFLDERQKQWFAWPTAAKTGGPCISCHTGLPYLIARPGLRRVLGETEPTKWETGLLDSLRARLEGKPAGSAQSIGTESIMAAVFLRDNPAAQEHLWNLQLRDGKRRGGWSWFELELDPWENTEAPFFGASLVALTVSPSRSGDQVEALTEYLKSAAQDQPLQNRLTLLWTARNLPGVSRREWIDEAFAKQAEDGGWSNEAIGPWKARPAAVAAPGSNAYATAFVAFALLEGGVKANDARLGKALGWLRSHQDQTAGYWDARSMNKRFPAGSMEEQFMRDAATGFAAAALVRAEAAAR